MICIDTELPICRGNNSFTHRGGGLQALRARASSCASGIASHSGRVARILSGSWSFRDFPNSIADGETRMSWDSTIQSRPEEFLLTLESIPKTPWFAACSPLRTNGRKRDRINISRPLTGAPCTTYSSFLIAQYGLRIGVRCSCPPGTPQ